MHPKERTRQERHVHAGHLKFLSFLDDKGLCKQLRLDTLQGFEG